MKPLIPTGILLKLLNLKARNLVAQGLMAEAMEVISQAIVISPFSVSSKTC